MANAYLDQAPCARQVPLNRRIDHATKLAKEYKVDAVLFTYLKFCPCYGLAKNKFITSFQALGLPVLELASDYSLGDLGQIKTRLDAFVEVLAENGLRTLPRTGLPDEFVFLDRVNNGLLLGDGFGHGPSTIPACCAPRTPSKVSSRTSSRLGATITIRKRSKRCSIW